jgi:hypothetical protein
MTQYIWQKIVHLFNPDKTLRPSLLTPYMWNDRVVVRGKWCSELAELNDADKYTGRLRQTNTHGGVADSAAMHRS